MGEIAGARVRIGRSVVCQVWRAGRGDCRHHATGGDSGHLEVLGPLPSSAAARPGAANTAGRAGFLNSPIAPSPRGPAWIPPPWFWERNVSPAPAGGFRPPIHGLGLSRTSRRPLLHAPIRRKGAPFVLGAQAEFFQGFDFGFGKELLSFGHSGDLIYHVTSSPFSAPSNCGRFSQ